MALQAYRPCRFLTVGGIIEGPFWVINGVIAGCSMATTLIRVLAVGPMDAAMASIPPPVSFDIFIDDSDSDSEDDTNEHARDDSGNVWEL